MRGRGNRGEGRRESERDNLYSEWSGSGNDESSCSSYIHIRPFAEQVSQHF